jgi:DNA repair protein RadA/Sms
VWLVGHVTSAGDVAGPRTVEHDVDAVLELKQGKLYDGRERILRCPDKNRFGVTGRVGHFKLTGRGLVSIDAEGST